MGLTTMTEPLAKSPVPAFFPIDPIISDSSAVYDFANQSMQLEWSMEHSAADAPPGGDDEKPLQAVVSEPCISPKRRSSSLHIAVGRRDKSMVQLLLENGADVSKRDQQGRTVLHAAAEAGERTPNCVA